MLHFQCCQILHKIPTLHAHTWNAYSHILLSFANKTGHKKIETKLLKYFVQCSGWFLRPEWRSGSVLLVQKNQKQKSLSSVEFSARVRLVWFPRPEWLRSGTVTGGRRAGNHLTPNPLIVTTICLRHFRKPFILTKRKYSSWELKSTADSKPIDCDNNLFPKILYCDKKFTPQLFMGVIIYYWLENPLIVTTICLRSFRKTLHCDHCFLFVGVIIYYWLKTTWLFQQSVFPASEISHCDKKMLYKSSWE